MFHGLGGQFLQEPGRKGRLLLTPECPDPAAAEVQLALGPGDADEKQPPFLFQLLIVIIRTRVGEQSLLQRVHKDDREFETLGGVQRHQCHGAGLLVPAVDGRRQRDFGQEVVYRGPGMILVELASRRDQFVQIRQAILTVVARLPGQVGAITCAFQELADHLFGRVVAKRDQLLDQPRKLQQAAGRLVLESLDLPGLPRHGQEWDAPLSRGLNQMIERRLAQPPRRDVDDPGKGQIILGVGHQVEVRQDVLDFLPLIKRDAAHDLVGDLGGAKGLLDGTRQSGHPAEDRDVAESEFALPDQAVDLARDPLGLIGLAGVDGQLDRCARGFSVTRDLGLRSRLNLIR